jgi:hypothetical protein
MNIRKWLVVGILCFLLLLAAMGGFLCFLAIFNSDSPSKREEMRQATKNTISDLAQEIDVVSKAKGRLPADEGQLIAWLGKPLPFTAWGDPIKYYHHNEKEVYFVNTLTDFSNGGIIYSYSSDDKSRAVKTQPF